MLTLKSSPSLLSTSMMVGFLLAPFHLISARSSSQGFHLESRRCPSSVFERRNLRSGHRRDSRTNRVMGRTLPSMSNGDQDDGSVSSSLPSERNVLGGPLHCCCPDPATGYFRDGFCRTHSTDLGRHTVCAVVSAAFLDFSAGRGNDLITPRPEWNFPGLVAGDRWCLCVLRWKEALQHNVAPPVILEACHESALRHVRIEELEAHAWVNVRS
mmetsp:Transcript_12349/g.25198  ORF Transcript_12349/g.25198 Transcript_12349/m.25198 type:complete len:213 (-) Transcript_12349:155-793(-)